MKITLGKTLCRRDFLQQSLVAGAMAARGTAGSIAGAETGSFIEDAPNTHNWMVVGEQTAFISHLPMFDDLSDDKTAYISPHRYQVILEADFVRNGVSVRGAYTKDRRNNPSVRMYTLNPAKQFVLADLFKPNPQQPLKRSFAGELFRGHFERERQPFSVLQDVTVNVKRVIHAREFTPSAARPEQIEYLLFGRGQELFMAHRIVKPPEFDQLLSVAITGRKFTDEQLSRGLRVIVSGRANTAPTRLKEQETVEAAVAIPNEPTPVKVGLRGVREFYFEEGELLIPPAFDQTPEEKKAGF